MDTEQPRTLNGRFGKKPFSGKAPKREQPHPVLLEPAGGYPTFQKIEEEAAASGSDVSGLDALTAAARARQERTIAGFSEAMAIAESRGIKGGSIEDRARALLAEGCSQRAALAVAALL